MIHPVSSAHQNHTNHATQVSPQQRPQPKPQTSEVQDKVTLSTGDTDHDGDSK